MYIHIPSYIIVYCILRGHVFSWVAPNARLGRASCNPQCLVGDLQEVCHWDYEIKSIPNDCK